MPQDSLAPHLRAELPWVKVVLSIRELISHAISWCHHLHKVADSEPMRRCLVWMFRRAELGDLSRYQDLAALEKDGEGAALLTLCRRGNQRKGLIESPTLAPPPLRRRPLQLQPAGVQVAGELPC